MEEMSEDSGCRGTMCIGKECTEAIFGPVDNRNWSRVVIRFRYAAMRLLNQRCAYHMYSQVSS